MKNNVKLKYTCFLKEQIPFNSIPKVAFVGKSNVGKSSIINALLKTDISKCSKNPGKTKSINYYLVNYKIFFVDLPGYGFANVSKKTQNNWKELIDYFLYNTKNLKLVCLLIDPRNTVYSKDLLMKNWLINKNINYIIILTKIDKIKKTDIFKNIKVIKDIFKTNNIFISSTIKNIGISNIWKEIIKVL